MIEYQNLFLIVPKIEKLTVQGATPKTVAYELAKDIPSLLEYQVKTIARTETSKTSVAITGFKSKKNNIPCYQWKASGGRQGAIARKAINLANFFAYSFVACLVDALIVGNTIIFFVIAVIPAYINKDAEKINNTIDTIGIIPS